MIIGFDAEIESLSLAGFGVGVVVGVGNGLGEGEGAPISVIWPIAGKHALASIDRFRVTPFVLSCRLYAVHDVFGSSTT